jgi:acetyl esterase/lipase
VTIVRPLCLCLRKATQSIAGEIKPGYAHKLSQAGVTVTALRYLETVHDFVMLNAIMDTPAARSAIALANANLQQAFTR